MENMEIVTFTQQLHFHKAKYLGLANLKRAHDICTYLHKVIKVKKANTYAVSPNMQGRAHQFSLLSAKTTFCTRPAQVKFKRLLIYLFKSFLRDSITRIE
jgi:hypothetical protein